MPGEMADRLARLEQALDAAPDVETLLRVLLDEAASLEGEANPERLDEMAGLAAAALERKTAYARLREMSQRLVEAQEAERRRLALELHDSAGQLLTALKLGLSLLERRLGPDNPHAPLLSDALEMVDTVHEEIRAISRALQPPALARAGLDGSLRSLCSDFARQTGVQIAYQGDEPPELDVQVATTFYRFLQEALTNVRRHAQAQQVVVWLQVREDELCLSVRDDGVGLRDDALPRHGGLQGLRERFELIGGVVDIEAVEEGGTCVAGRYPLHPQATHSES